MKQEYYKKSGLVTWRIARELLSLSAGDRVPPIQDYAERLHASRGTVQSALLTLEAEGAVSLERHGKMGSYIREMNRTALFRLGELNDITGSMPAPISLVLAGLATGICRVLSDCPVPFAFAFVQSASRRAEALRRMTYDFAVVSEASAQRFLAAYPELALAAVLRVSQYSAPYMLFVNRAETKGLEDGFTIAADPASTDQWELTERLCAGKAVRIVPCPYISARAAFLSREVDAVVYRQGDVPQGEGIAALPLGLPEEEALQRPAILIHRENHGMNEILRELLLDEPIARAQQAVVSQAEEPRFY